MPEDEDHLTHARSAVPIEVRGHLGRRTTHGQFAIRAVGADPVDQAVALRDRRPGLERGAGVSRTTAWTVTVRSIPSNGRPISSQRVRSTSDTSAIRSGSP